MENQELTTQKENSIQDNDFTKLVSAAEIIASAVSTFADGYKTKQEKTFEIQKLHIEPMPAILDYDYRNVYSTEQALMEFGLDFK